MNEVHKRIRLVEDYYAMLKGSAKAEQQFIKERIEWNSNRIEQIEYGKPNQ